MFDNPTSMAMALFGLSGLLTLMAINIKKWDGRLYVTALAVFALACYVAYPVLY